MVGRPYGASALTRTRTAVCVVAAALALLAAPFRVLAQRPPDPSEIINTLLASLMGFRDMTGPELQREIAEVGGVPFRSDVPVDFLSRTALSSYLKDVLDTEYPPERARADQRTLVALDLLAPGIDLRRMRAELLEQNVAGFYDERPGRKRLYAVSDDRSLTPANQLVLAHELRHALQDQYADVHGTLPASVGDFDDRRLAFLSLLEGDATLVMERFLLRRLPGAPESMGDLTGLAVPEAAMPGVPPVLQDQLVQPYFIGRDFARELLNRGGWNAIRQAWTRPPASTEQVLHPEKYFDGEAPRTPELSYTPPGGRAINEGVLGEMLVRTLLGDGGTAAAAGWGGDLFRVWDVSGRTLLVWVSSWDSAADAREFAAAVRGRFAAHHGGARQTAGFDVFSSGPWRFAVGDQAGRVVFLSTDDPAGLEKAAGALGGTP
jgi:hypothetical protein